MKLSIFSTTGNASGLDNQDPLEEALACYRDLADEVVLMNGNLADKKTYDGIKVVYSDWPEEFSWEFIGQQFQRGYEACTGDWVIHADLDFFFHEKDIAQIRKVLEESDAPALSFYKHQFLLGDRYRLKSRLVVAVNKGKYGDRIKFNSGGDLCQPSLDGMELKPDAVPEARCCFYNYDFTFKDKEIIAREFNRMAKARQKMFPNDNWGVESPESALEFFKRMQVGRFNNNSGWQMIKLEDHPKYIQEKLKNLTPEMFGYNMFGWVEDKCVY